MKTLYYFKADSAFATIFVDKNGGMIRDLHENDGDFNQEHMGFIAQFFGGKTVEIQLKGKLVQEENADRFVDANRSAIVAAIAKAK